jgi:hypothetical protein
MNKSVFIYSKFYNNYNFYNTYKFEDEDVDYNHLYDRESK